MAEEAPVASADVLLAGPVFFDLVFTGLDTEPAPGTEVYARGMDSSPGGVANLAVATARLGLSTSLAAVLGDDVYGRWCWDFLASNEGVDLSGSRLLDGWPTPVTVSIASGADRSMVTREEESPVAAAELVAAVRGRATFVDLGVFRGSDPHPWWQDAARAGTQVFADIGWDASGRWDPHDLRALADCSAFTPNESEATAYTRTDSALGAARALAERVPLVVVTRGELGAVAVDSASGEEVVVDAVPAAGRDATGAGDVFGAALLTGTLGGWLLEDRLSFAALCASLAVEHAGGAVGAPAWGDVSDWWARARTEGDREVLARFGFLSDVLPSGTLRRRAELRFPFTEAGRDQRVPAHRA